MEVTGTKEVTKEQETEGETKVEQEEEKEPKGERSRNSGRRKCVPSSVSIGCDVKFLEFVKQKYK